VLFGFASFFQKRNHEKCTNMILKTLKAKEKKTCAQIFVCASTMVCMCKCIFVFCIFMKMMDIESSYIVCHDSLLLVLETHPALNALQG
jgi:hypothetical protein